MDNKKISDALSVIKELCTSTTCFSCPLRVKKYGCVDGYSCGLVTSTPACWHFVPYQEEWRPFPSNDNE